MTRPRRPKLTDPQRRAALERELVEYALIAARAMEDLKIHVSRAYDAGMTTREMGELLDVTGGTISIWKEIGEQARVRRRGGDPGGPRE